MYLKCWFWSYLRVHKDRACRNSSNSWFCIGCGTGSAGGFAFSVIFWHWSSSVTGCAMIPVCCATCIKKSDQKARTYGELKISPTLLNRCLASAGIGWQTLRATNTGLWSIKRRSRGWLQFTHQTLACPLCSSPSTAGSHLQERAPLESGLLCAVVRLNNSVNMALLQLLPLQGLGAGVTEIQELTGYCTGHFKAQAVCHRWKQHESKTFCCNPDHQQLPVSLQNVKEPCYQKTDLALGTNL